MKQEQELSSSNKSLNEIALLKSKIASLQDQTLKLSQKWLSAETTDWNSVNLNEWTSLKFSAGPWRTAETIPGFESPTRPSAADQLRVDGWPWQRQTISGSYEGKTVFYSIGIRN